MSRRSTLRPRNQRDSSSLRKWHTSTRASLALCPRFHHSVPWPGDCLHRPNTRHKNIVELAIYALESLVVCLIKASVLAFSGLKNRDISLETYSVLRTLKPKSALYYRSGSPTLRNGFGRLGAVSEQGSNSSAPVGSHTPTTCRAFQYMQHNLRPRHSQKHCKTSAYGHFLPAVCDRRTSLESDLEEVPNRTYKDESVIVFRRSLSLLQKGPA